MRKRGMARAQDSGDLSGLLNSFSTKLRDIEEKNINLKERIDLLNQTFLKEEKRLVEEIISMKTSLKEIKDDTSKIKEGMKSMISESSNFARKEEMAILERYMKVWEPLKFVRDEDVKRIVEEKFKEKGI